MPIPDRRFAAALAYDGGAFCGWQTQPQGCGVQDAVQKALAATGTKQCTATAAGRTDTGVHAISQIVHFDAGKTAPPNLRGVNHFLHPQAAMLWAQVVGDDFHARYCATARRYHYVICAEESLMPVLGGRVCFCRQKLDAEAMRRAATMLTGEHDFSSFRAAGCSAKTPRRHLREIMICDNAPFLSVAFCADGFLRRMVLNITGALLVIGRGEKPPQWAEELLAAKNRNVAPKAAPAEGLYFVGADYPARFNLPPTVRRLPFG
ncbi:MAG: tRNA pseudouridine(38-40) synthase TruA [Gammaproteobacteria bacterium]